MPASRTTTPAQQRVRDIADQALKEPDGITIWFRTSQYGSLKAANSAALGYQQAFSAMRARARRLAQRQSGEAHDLLDGFSHGPYDSLAVSKQWLPDDEGVTLIFLPSYAFGMDLEITSNATGEPLAAEDPIFNRCVAIANRFGKVRRESNRDKTLFINPLTDDEMRFVWEHSPDTAEFYGFGLAFVAERRGVDPEALRLGREGTQRRVTDYASVDLATLSEDELEIVNPGDEV